VGGAGRTWTDRLESVATAPRKGFETEITLETSEACVGVQARDGSGRVLDASETIKPGA
jgi:hypothetical protein